MATGHINAFKSTPEALDGVLGIRSAGSHSLINSCYTNKHDQTILDKCADRGIRAFACRFRCERCAGEANVFKRRRADPL